jgi:DNA polymerase III sliding clamp (beta) subunit (PCNA family)
MQFSTTRQQMIDALESLKKVAGNYKQLSVLDYAHISVYPDRALITGSDLEIHVTAHINSPRVDNDGECTIHVEKTLKMLKNFEDSWVTISNEDEERTIWISCGDDNFKHFSESVDDFPNIVEHKEPEWIGMFDKKDLITSINKLNKCKADPDERRPHITGMRFKVEDDILNITSTNGKWLLNQEFSLGEPVKEKNFLVPRKSLVLLKYIFHSKLPENKYVYLQATESWLHIWNNECYVKINMLEGDFPNIKNILSQSSSFSFKFSRKQMIKTCDKVLALNNNCKAFYLNFNGGELKAQSYSANEEFNSVLDVEYDGNVDVDNALINPNYWKTFCGVFNSEKLEVHVSNVFLIVVKDEAEGLSGTLCQVAQ